jgi:hypothetical protein
MYELHKAISQGGISTYGLNFICFGKSNRARQQYAFQLCSRGLTLSRPCGQIILGHAVIGSPHICNGLCNHAKFPVGWECNSGVECLPNMRQALPAGFNLQTNIQSTNQPTSQPANQPNNQTNKSSCESYLRTVLPRKMVIYGQDLPMDMGLARLSVIMNFCRCMHLIMKNKYVK